MNMFNFPKRDPNPGDSIKMPKENSTNLWTHETTWINPEVLVKLGEIRGIVNDKIESAEVERVLDLVDEIIWMLSK